MEKLTQIDLSNNWLTYVDPYIFTDLASPEWTADVTTNPFICDCGIEGKTYIMPAISIKLGTKLFGPNKPAITFSFGTKYACNLGTDGDHICLQ